MFSPVDGLLCVTITTMHLKAHNMNELGGEQFQQTSLIDISPSVTVGNSRLGRYQFTTHIQAASCRGFNDRGPIQDGFRPRRRDRHKPIAGEPVAS